MPATPHRVHSHALPDPDGTTQFKAKVTKVARDRLPYSWRPGWPGLHPASLRKITMTLWGFDDRTHTGELIVNNSAVTGDVTAVFEQLYKWRYPIKKMEPVDVYKGGDFDSIEADNTSAFNCRGPPGPAAGRSTPTGGHRPQPP